MCLQAQSINKIQKRLIEQYSYQQKVKNQDKDIQIYCLKHQKLNKLNKKSSFDNSSQKSNYQNKIQFSKENSLTQINLLEDYEKQLQIINAAKAHTKPIHCLINQDFMQTQKQQTIQQSVNKSMKSLANSHNFSMKNGQSADFTKTVNGKTKQIDKNQLTNDNFKLILYQQYMRNNDFNIKHSLTSSNISQLNFSNNRSGKINHEKAQIDYDKKQSQVYNKMQLNGQVIKNTILLIKIKLSNKYSMEMLLYILLISNVLVYKHQMINQSLKEKEMTKNLQDYKKRIRKYRLIQEIQDNQIFKQHSLKFNQSGIIRNQKYNKSIKSVLRGFQINSQKKNYKNEAKSIITMAPKVA